MERNGLAGRVILMLLSLCFWTGWVGGSVSYAQPTEGGTDGRTAQHLVVLMVPALGFEEVEKWMEGLPEEIQSHIQLAGMTMRTAGRMDWVNNLFTISTGQFAEGPPLWNGYQLRGGTIIHPVQKLRQQQEQRSGFLLSAESLPWDYFLGETLKKNQVYTVAFGNSDTRQIMRRMGATIIMDNKGYARGQIDKTILTPAPYEPGGWRTDWDKLSMKLEEIWKIEQPTLAVVELGDLWRIEQTYDKVPKSARISQIYKDKWLREWRNWFMDTTRHIQHNQDGGVSIWIMTPAVSNKAKLRGQLLTPFITWHPEQTGGILSSLTTKQNGVVANVDFLPTLLAYYQLPAPSQAYGQVIQLKETLKPSTQPGSSLFDPFFDHLRYLFAIYRTRRIIISVYLLSMIFLLIATACYWWFSKQYWWARLVQVLIGTVLLSPIYFLWLTPLIQVIGPYKWIVVLFFSAFVTSFVLYQLVSHVWFLTLIGLTNTLIILFDLWRGSIWMRRSFLGYDPLIGARFYGLGNEYAGILLGSSLLAVTGISVWLARNGWLPKRRVKGLLVIFMCVFYLVIIYSMAAPRLGTNAGATIAALLTYGVSLLFLFRLKISLRYLLPLFGVVMLSMAGLVHLHLQGEHTHIGSFVVAAQNGDLKAIQEVISRKLAMNWRLIKVSLWGKLFTTALMVMGLVSFRLRRQPLYKNYEDMAQHNLWMTGFRTMIVGALVILMANDSGIVAAATTIIFLAFPFIFLRFNRHSIRADSTSSGLA
ncbi:membrane protein [Caldalkalibacillus thermarum]|nr:membrane protein [Caldalkalibacillus thermarum]